MKDRRLSAVAVGLLTLALLVTLAGIASATVKITDVLKAWDDKTNRYENGNLTLRLNDPADPTPELEPFWVEIGFDNGLHSVPGCGTTGQTKFAGDALIGLYHLDTTGGHGFQSSQNWGLVDCSTLASNKFPPSYIFECVDPADPNANQPCEVISKDVVTPCSSGNCTEEIVTNFDLVLDTDCDGVIDPQFAPAGGLCMYWAAPKPTTTPPIWSGNLQVRINAGGGDKTINFNDLVGPNAVGLRDFAAAAGARPWALALVAGILALAGVIFAWRSARG